MPVGLRSDRIKKTWRTRSSRQRGLFSFWKLNNLQESLPDIQNYCSFPLALRYSAVLYNACRNLLL